MTEQSRIAFVTLGCAKNEVDTDKMQARLKDAGYAIIDDCSQADLVIVNTCAFLESAVEESLEVIFDLSNTPRPDGKKPRILVAGCMPARYGEDLKSELTEAAGFLRAADEEQVVSQVAAILGKDQPKADDCFSACASSLRHTGGPSAYVKISDGCNRFCSYCMIPYIRGRYHSFSYEEIEAEVSELVDMGVREIVLIGQDTGIWGRDFDEPLTTAWLLQSLSAKYPDTWFRLLYVQPEGISDELLDVMASTPNVCSYIDMPLQHADAQVLKRMNRTGDAMSFLKLIKRIRSRVPGVLLRSTFIAGFPGETTEQFKNLLDFVEEAEFDYAAVFPYSPEEGSAAFGFDGQIDEEERMSRAQTLLDLCENIGTSRIAELVGGEYPVLVEGYERTDVGVEALCRLQGQAPEVDGQVHVPLASEDDLLPGQIVHVLLTGSFFFELEGEVLAS